MSAYKYCEIAKGVKFLCVNSDKFKTNCISVDFYLPLGENLAEYNVLSSFMGHTSKKYSNLKQFNCKLEDLYGADFTSSIATVGEKIRLRFSIEMPDDKFSLDDTVISTEASDFLIDVLKMPNCIDGSFDEGNTELEKRFTLENLESIKNDKRSYALSRLRYLMCKDEKYGIDNEKLISEVSCLDGKKLFEAYEKMLKQATVIITLCGSIDGDAMRAKFTDFAESIKDRCPVRLETQFIEKADEVKYFKETMQVNQAKLVLGFRAGMKNSFDNYYAYRVMTDIFGGGPYSRLFANVREKMSLCYYCGARLIREKGIIFVQSGIEEENYENALSEILNQLDIMKKGDFSQDELQSSLKALSDAFSGVEDTPSAVCTFYSSQAFDEELLTGAEFAQKLSAVTGEQVKQCANTVTLDSVYLLAGEGESNE